MDLEIARRDTEDPTGFASQSAMMPWNRPDSRAGSSRAGSTRGSVSADGINRRRSSSVSSFEFESISRGVANQSEQGEGCVFN